MSTPVLDDVQAVPLEELDVSRPEIFKNDNWQPWFARLRREAPVHYLADSANGAFWSVTNHKLIKEVDTNNAVFSSEKGGISIVDLVPVEGQIQGRNFIAMDEPEHAKQRMAVSPTVAPKNLAELEPLIRERAIDILENLPVGETFNWVQEVSVELTARMLATLFDFPYEDRGKLVYWSDLATAVPQVTGDASIDMKKRYDELMGCAAAFYQLWMSKVGQPPSFDLISMLQHNPETARMNEDADKLIIDRLNARAHVAFGFGVHRCMGNRLAELQLRVLWEEIMKRFHTIELVGDVERIPNNFIRGIKDVPVRLHPLKR